ncbi:MAG: SH3 domain-containing protein [Caldilinea sp.]|nr:SH3 domain-containing protein [Caldilinea sp.]MCB9122506.1 SH3 domain-containing protein [Caldilineaceae bacterium]MCO5214124.1 SH3 domain-containing protein [Caldilinea sp.]MCW5842292.1 SH3 domain-containing protein [Caldilinea sp.]
MQNTRLDKRSSSSGMGRILEGPAAWLVTFLLIPGLIVAILLLPPISLLNRLESFTFERISANTGGAIQDPDGTTVNFPAEGVLANFQAQIKSTPRTDFIEGQAGNDLYEAAQSLPDTLIAKSPVYHVEMRGREPAQAIVTIPIPNDSLPYETLALYEWTGDRWRYVPSSVLADADIVEARLDYVPQNFMVVQSLADVPEVTLNLGLDGQDPQNAVYTNATRGTLNLRGDGGLDGQAPPNSGTTIPVVTNVEAQTVRTDLINNLLVDPGLQDNQFTTLEQLVVNNGYPGLQLDYRGVDAVPSARADYVRFVDQVAERLHAANKTLAVRVEAPTPVSAEEWNTGGYDWRGLGQVVDELIIPAPVDPRAYAPGGEMELLLAYATDQVEPGKVSIELAGQSVERSGNYLLLKGYQDSLQPLLGTISAETGADNSVSISLDNPRLQGQVQWDDQLGIYSYTYTDDQGLQRTVYVESAGSLGRKLDLLRKYNVTNVSLNLPANGDVDPAMMQVLQRFQMGESTSSAPQAQMAVAYTLYGEDGSVVSQQIRPLDSPSVDFAMPAEAAAGELRVDAQLVNANGTALTAPKSAVLSLAAGKQPAAAAEAVADVSLNVDQIVNVRGGPGTGFAVLGQIVPGSNYKVTGKTPAADWWQIEFDDGNGWVISQLATTNGDGNAVAVVENLPQAPAAPAVAAAPAEAAPVAEAAAEAAPAEVAAASAAPAPVAAPTGGGSFGYGIQGHVVDNGQIFPVLDSIGGLGFNWFKQQIEWKRFESAGPGQIDWGAMDEIVNASGSRGVSVLFSIVKAPAWARESGFDGSVEGPPSDPQTYANFVGAVAGRYCGKSLKAIEVWNEQNLHYEWGNKALNPGEYVALLAPAFNAIKGACPSMLVISGALTPAGNNAPYAMDDFTYLEEMFKAGANNYLDGVGAHPSGYNVPPSVTWEGACEAIQKTGNSFNGACDSPHHSWSFQSTMTGYYNIMNVYGGGNKLVWPTEFGWAAGGAFNPAYKYADDNDYQEQAQWTVEAYQMMRNWGWVGPAFLWNLNFRVIADRTELAQWGIVDSSWNPLPAYTALAQMPK